jgi:PIN domain nuclease of toxin-antitoxin system
MRYLLDTHTFLWFIEDSPNLPKSTKTVIEAADSDVYLSIASLWEIAIKVGMGKLQIPQPFETFINGQLLHNRIYVLQVAIAHAAAVVQLPHHHRDPFDRMLIAQAQVENMTFISRDPVMDA